VETGFSQTRRDNQESTASEDPDLSPDAVAIRAAMCVATPHAPSSQTAARNATTAMRVGASAVCFDGLAFVATANRRSETYSP